MGPSPQSWVWSRSRSELLITKLIGLWVLSGPVWPMVELAAGHGGFDVDEKRHPEGHEKLQRSWQTRLSPPRSLMPARGATHHNRCRAAQSITRQRDFSRPLPRPLPIQLFTRLNWCVLSTCFFFPSSRSFQTFFIPMSAPLPHVLNLLLGVDFELLSSVAKLFCVTLINENPPEQNLNELLRPFCSVMKMFHWWSSAASF